MAKHTHWAKLWWAILQQFGKECYRTWVSEVLSMFAGGVAGAMTNYLLSHGHTSFIDAVFNGSIGAAIVFGLYAIVNLFRSIWLEHKSESGGTNRQGVGGAFVVLFLVCAVGSGVVLAYESFRSDITTLSASADPGAKDAELAQCKAKYEAKKVPAESPKSLRRRIWRLTREMDDFYTVKRQEMQAQPLGANEDQGAYQARVQTHWQEVEQECKRKFQDRATGIVQELKAKGVNTHILNDGDFSVILDQRCLGPQEVAGLRELAYRVDAQDNAITPTF
jgi:hypothetical protein